jgi:hypothetical protein
MKEWILAQTHNLHRPLEAFRRNIASPTDILCEFVEGANWEDIGEVMCLSANIVYNPYRGIWSCSERLLRFPCSPTYIAFALPALAAARDPNLAEGLEYCALVCCLGYPSVAGHRVGI